MCLRAVARFSFLQRPFEKDGVCGINKEAAEARFDLRAKRIEITLNPIHSDHQRIHNQEVLGVLRQNRRDTPETMVPSTYEFAGPARRGIGKSMPVRLRSRPRTFLQLNYPAAKAKWRGKWLRGAKLPSARAPRRCDARRTASFAGTKLFPEPHAPALSARASGPACRSSRGSRRCRRASACARSAA